jgi:replicative superfamily II helicase
MAVDDSSFLKLDQHWAVRAVGAERLRKAHTAASRLFIQNNIGAVLQGEPVAPHEEQLIHTAATAYEAAAAEGVTELLRSQRSNQSDVAVIAEAAAYRAFELRRALPLDLQDLQSFTYQVLQLGAFAYTSDRWAEFRAWLRDRDIDPDDLPDAEPDWEGQVLRSLSQIWIRLLRKKGWADLSAVGREVISLRERQDEKEAEYLQAARVVGLAKPRAWRLVSLYHWARASELLAEYLMQGSPGAIRTELDFHFERAIEAASAAVDIPTEVTLRWLHLLASRMASGSLWALTSVGEETRKLVSVKTSRAMFELLPPQRSALLEQGLLDQASTAVIVDLPTSAGKTILAEFKVVQALNQFRQAGGWVAYVAPTRALVSQITRRLRRDLSPMGIAVEQLSAAVDLDDIEGRMVSAEGAFDVLVATPEKLHLLVRNNAVARPMALLILDEAQNIEDQERGVRIELLLATVKQDCPDANFLLMMPYVPNASDLARWLSPESGRSISLGTSSWQPNDRIIGLVQVTPPSGSDRRQWSLKYQQLTTSTSQLVVEEHMRIGEGPSFDLTHSSVKNNLGLIAAAAARQLSTRGTSIVMARTLDSAWRLARTLKQSFFEPCLSEKIALVQRFLATEVSPYFELIELLEYGIGVHHSGLSDETRSLMEWLAEEGDLRVLVATTGIAQGLNFPVSSLFIASRQVPAKNHSRPMPSRSFWNLVGRAGRVDQDSIGVVGLASREDGSDAEEIVKFVQEKTEDLASRLVKMLEELASAGRLLDLSRVIYTDQWSDFRSFIAHLYNQSSSLNDLLARTEITLRNTFGYNILADGDDRQREQGRALLIATREYAENLSAHPENAKLADSTGFSPESVRAAIQELRHVDRSLNVEDWMPESLFGRGGDSALPDLMGVMMRVPQIMEDISALSTAEGYSHERVAEVATAWVHGVSIREIAERYFTEVGETVTTEKLSEVCRLIYRNLVPSGTWGIAALSKMPTSGLDYENMSESALSDVNMLGAMMYHGVATRAGVMLRMASAPRSVADALGRSMVLNLGDSPNAREVRDYLRNLPASDWERHRPEGAMMSGRDYKEAWGVLSGEQG